MSFRSKGLLARMPVFFLAWLSFACLLGQMYGLWSMRAFGRFIFLTASAHAVFGIALGLWCWLRLGMRDSRTA